MTLYAASAASPTTTRSAETFRASIGSFLVVVVVAGILTQLKLPAAIVEAASTGAGGMVPVAIVALQRRARVRSGAAVPSVFQDPTINPALVSLPVGFALALADFLLSTFAYGTIVMTGFPGAQYGETQMDYGQRLFLMAVVREAPLLFLAATLIAAAASRRLGACAIRWLLWSVPLYALLTEGLNLLYHVATDSVTWAHLGPELMVLPAFVLLVLAACAAGHWWSMRNRNKSLHSRS
jgi:hypothetical protein